MKLDQLKALDAVVRAGSFAKAANEILLVTQPAVTKAVQNLEESIGFALFSRENYRPQLTPQGQVFYQKALLILQDVKELASWSEQISRGVESELYISIDTHFMLPCMLNALHQSHQTYSETQLHIRYEKLGASMRKLKAHECDLALVLWLPDYASDRTLNSKIIKKIEASTVVSADFPLLKQQGPITQKDLAPYIQVIERTDSSETGASRSINPYSQHWYVNDVLMKKQIILSGQSYGLLPYYLIEKELEEGKLVPFENYEAFYMMRTELRAVSLKSRHMGPVLSHLWQKLA